MNLKGHSTRAPTYLGRIQLLTMNGLPGSSLATQPSVFGYVFTLFTREALIADAASGNSTFIELEEDGNGWFRLAGLETGASVVLIGDEEVIPGIAPNAPNLQYATQLFITTDLGISARTVGPRGNQSCQRRVVMDAPQEMFAPKKTFYSHGQQNKNCQSHQRSNTM